MRDFTAHVRRHLPRSTVSVEHYDKIVDELAGELEARYTEAIRRGATEEDAWAHAIAEIPSWPELAHALATTSPRANPARRNSPIAWLERVTDRWFGDVKIALRSLRKDRVYTLTTVGTLAICLGGNVAILAGVNAVLRNPLRVREPDRVLLMANQYPKVEKRIQVVSATPDYEDRLKYIGAFDEQALYNYVSETIEADGVPTRTIGIITSPSLLRLLQVKPALGRVFLEDEGVRGNDQRVILSDGLWRELFGGDPTAIGRTLRLTGRPFTIVGVLPPAVTFGGVNVRFWIPLALNERQRSDSARHGNGWFSVGRLKRGATIDQVREQLRSLDAVNFERTPAALKQVLADTGFYTSVEPLQDALVRDVRAPVTVLWAAALIVLALGVANIGHLAVARSRLRLPELATRLAIGARASDIVRSLLIEGWLTTFAGAATGLGVGAWIVAALRLPSLTVLQNVPPITIDRIVVVVVFVIAAMVGLAIGLISAMPLITTRLGALLKDGARTVQRRPTRAARRALVIAQMTCSFVLVVGAGLLWLNLRSILAVDTGFNPRGVISGVVSLTRPRYATDDAALTFVTRSLDAIRRLPGVTAAGVTSIIPAGSRYSSGVIIAEGYAPKLGEAIVPSIRAFVGPGYFEAVSTPLIRGRYFDARDDSPETRGMIIDEWIARRFWGNDDPLGHRMFAPMTPEDLSSPVKENQWLTVVGVVRHARLRGPNGVDDNGVVYMPASRTPLREVGYVVRTAVEPGAMAAPLRAAIASIDRELPMADVLTLEERTSATLAPQSTTMRVATLFALTAMLLSAIGLYGVLTYLVTQRTREIGVRVAIGSTPSAILTMVMREGLTLAAAGIALGVIGARALGPLLTTQLGAFESFNPWLVPATALALGLIALIACVFPARRAASVDAISVLQSH